MKLLTFLVILTLCLSLSLVGCTESVTTENNPYSGTCPQGKESADCLGECGNFVDFNEDHVCDRNQ
jgi:hypothetical protein